MMMHRLAALGLSEEQQAKVKEILEGTKAKMQDLAKKAQDGALDFDAVRAERQKLHKETEEAIQALLTAEQKEKFAKPPMPPQGPPKDAPR